MAVFAFKRLFKNWFKLDFLGFVLVWCTAETCQTQAGLRYLKDALFYWSSVSLFSTFDQKSECMDKAYDADVMKEEKQ